MAGRIVWTQAAADDLHALAAFIAQDNPAAARNLVARILARIDTAAAFPQAQRIVPELGDPTTREALLAPYRIVYALDTPGGGITILRIWHAARGIPELGKGRGA